MIGSSSELQSSPVLTHLLIFIDRTYFFLSFTSNTPTLKHNTGTVEPTRLTTMTEDGSFSNESRLRLKLRWLKLQDSMTLSFRTPMSFNGDNVTLGTASKSCREARRIPHDRLSDSSFSIRVPGDDGCYRECILFGCLSRLKKRSNQSVLLEKEKDTAVMSKTSYETIFECDDVDDELSWKQPGTWCSGAWLSLFSSTYSEDSPCHQHNTLVPLPYPSLQ